MLVREEGRTWKPIYYISQALRGAEMRYPRIELLAFAMEVVAILLKPNFQALLKKVVQRIDMSGRMVTLSIKLSEFDLDYLMRNATKG